MIKKDSPYICQKIGLTEKAKKILDKYKHLSVKERVDKLFEEIDKVE